MRNQNEKTTFEFAEVNGFGKVLLLDNTCIDIFVYGYFEMFGWHFIVHQDVESPEYVVISEASSGCLLQTKYNYEDVEDALYYEIPRIREKRYYFATSVGNVLVRHQKNLLKSNVGLRTLAIDTALWM